MLVTVTHFYRPDRLSNSSLKQTKRRGGRCCITGVYKLLNMSY